MGFDGCGYVDLFALEVPEGGGKIKTIFTALDKGAKLADGDSGMCTTNGVSQEVPDRIYNDTELGGERGFRHGYVALLKKRRTCLPLSG